MTILVTNLCRNVQLLENNTNELFYIKLFTTYLDYHTFIQTYHSCLENYIINNLDINSINKSQYSNEEILNYKLSLIHI